MRKRLSRAAAAAAILALLVDGAPAQTAQEKPFVERVEVNVRTILVRITDRDGKPASPAPGAEDLQILEDGKPMRVLGVDPARPAPAPAVPTSPPELPKTPLPASQLGAPRSTGIPQHLYLDTTTLDPGSVARAAGTFEDSLGAVLANGPLEIVVADPLPHQFMEATRDPQAVRRGLERLRREVAGKQALLFVRRQSIDHMRNDPCPNLEMTVRSAAEQELRIIQDSLERLVRWAASLGGQRPDVVYFVSDGYDADVTETYVKVIRETGTRPAGSLCAPTKPPEQLETELPLEFGTKGGELTGRAAKSLAALGVQAVPIALGGNLLDIGGDASSLSHDGFNSRLGSVPIFAQPISPMRTIAETTGGDVVTSAGHFPAALNAYDTAYVVSFRSEHAPDGQIHSLKVTSLREGLVIRSPGYMTEGTPDSVAAGMSVRALNEPPPQGGFPIKLAIDSVAKNGKQLSGVLHVDADLAALSSTLDLLNGGRIRVTMAVDVAGAREPFTTTQEFDVAPHQAGWGADIPITWPAKGRKVAVTVEELKTGTRATGAVDLPTQ